MPHPKHKISKSRRDKRRTHYKGEAPAAYLCKETGTMHVPHIAYNVDGNLYYRGRIIIEKTREE